MKRSGKTHNIVALGKSTIQETTTMGSVRDACISSNDEGTDQQKPKAQTHRRVSIEARPDDHPLFTIRKRMKTGLTRHAAAAPSLRTYGKSASILLNDPDGQERLRNLLERVQNEDARTHAATLMTPRGEDGIIATSPPPTPPTPGRQHDIVWEQEPPTFFPLGLAASNAPSPTPVSSMDSDEDDLVARSPPRDIPKFNLQPRLQCPWLLEALGLPVALDVKEDCDHELMIPFAPFAGTDDDNDDDGGGHAVKKVRQTTAKVKPPPKAGAGPSTRTSMASVSDKLAGLSLSVSSAAKRSSLNRQKSMNARSA